MDIACYFKGLLFIYNIFISRLPSRLSLVHSDLFIKAFQSSISQACPWTVPLFWASLPPFSPVPLANSVWTVNKLQQCKVSTGHLCKHNKPNQRNEALWGRQQSRANGGTQRVHKNTLFTHAHTHTHTKSFPCSFFRKGVACVSHIE